MKSKVFLVLLYSSLFVGFVTGCTKSKQIDLKESEQQSRGKCEVEQCIRLIEPTMSIEEVNEIIGFIGEKKDGIDTYIWQLTDKTKIEVEYKDNLGTITATMDKNKIKNDKFKLSICFDIQKSLKSGTSFTYEEMVQKLEGIEGYLATKAPTFKRYIWVNRDNQTFGATFSDSLDGKCSITSIR